MPVEWGERKNPVEYRDEKKKSDEGEFEIRINTADLVDSVVKSIVTGAATGIVLDKLLD